MIALPMLSHIAVPLWVDGNWVCALLTATAMSYRTWKDAEIEQVRIVGQIIANAVYRRKLERELRESLDEVRRLEGRLRAENEYLREAVGADAGFEQIAGRSRALRQVLEQAALVAPTGTSVLLQGETGTGKELLARAIHARSKRSAGPLITVNCAALPHSLVESELFGHEKGAFTGATSVKLGRFELADGGTLFLDEVGEIPPEIQVKLLRVLQFGEFERVGGSRTRKVDVRIVAATNRDLERAIAEGRFREDLYYRLSVFPIRLPPLRERLEDIPLLVQDLIQRRQDELGRRIERIPDAGDAGAHDLRLARQRARARQRDRARADPVARSGAAVSTPSWHRRGRARCRRSASTSSNARTSWPCSSAVAGGSPAPATPPKLSACAPAPCARASRSSASRDRRRRVRA